MDSCRLAPKCWFSLTLIIIIVADFAFCSRGIFADIVTPWHTEPKYSKWQFLLKVSHTIVLLTLRHVNLVN